MNKYRISKYSPKYRNEEGEYTREEWTSYADIGKVFGGEQLTKEEYLNVEKKYEDTVKAIFIDNDTSSVIVEGLECNFTINELKQMLGSRGIKLSDKDIRIIRSLKNGYVTSLNDVETIISLILRECCWCKLLDPNKNFSVEFGYDFYIYITCDKVAKRTIQEAEALGIYIECM